MIQLGLDKLNIVARQFSGDSLQAVRNMTRRAAVRSKIYMYVSLEMEVFLWHFDTWVSAIEINKQESEKVQLISILM